MGYRFILITFLKGACFAVPLLMISVALKSTFPYTCKSVPCLKSESIGEDDRPSFYFIGTSRVQRSISPATLQTDLPDYNFINLGLSDNSFLYSCKAASNLLKQNSGKKIIFIELTGLTLLPPEANYYYLSLWDAGAVVRQHMSIQCTPEDMNQLLFYVFSIHSDIKKIVYPRLNLGDEPEIGFMEDLRGYGSLNAMLTPKSFTIGTVASPDLLETYMEVINQLRKEAEEKGSEIQFILPLMIREESEFHIDMSVFARLPEDLKWSYSDEFLKAMNSSRYLSDELHLNSEGAVIYSHELSKFIEVRFSTGRLE